jgi:hypothetical protein
MRREGMTTFPFFVVAKTTEVDGLRFNDKDLETVGTLEYAQFGVVRVYVSLSHFPAQGAYILYPD